MASNDTFRGRALLACGTALLLAACGGGGGGADSVATPPPAPTALSASVLAVVIAEGDATSEAIGRAYQQARGIPEANMIRVPLATGSPTITPGDFAALKAAIDSRLPASVQAQLVTWTQPSRVAGTCSMGITSALAFSYDPRYCATVCAPTAASPYYNTDTHQPWTDLRVRPAMMLGASSLAEAQALINRGVAAAGRLAGGSPVAQAWLVRTTDVERSVRYADFRTLSGTTLAGVRFNYVDNAAGTGSNVVSGQADVLVYLTGLDIVPQTASNTYLPGAVADHLTSYGGVLEGRNGQMPATTWLQSGVTGTYGTVEEPCNYVEKFPRASVLIPRYQRGDTLIEAYWKSVQWPGQGLFLGEPLARPFAR